TTSPVLPLTLDTAPPPPPPPEGGRAQVPSPRRKVSSEGVPVASMSPTVCVCSTSAFPERALLSPITLLWGSAGMRSVVKSPLPILLVGSSGMSSTSRTTSPVLPLTLDTAPPPPPPPAGGSIHCEIGRAHV